MLFTNDNILLDQLKNEESPSFELLYQLYFPSILAYVRQNDGMIEDAEDIFQEAIMVLLQKVREPNFILTSSLKTYLYAISKNLWLKRLRDNKIANSNNESLLNFYQAENEGFSIEIEPQKTDEEKVESLLQKITANCQRILKAIFFYGEPMESLMIKMGWKNRHTADNQKYKCIQQAKNIKEIMD